MFTRSAAPRAETCALFLCVLLLGPAPSIMANTDAMVSPQLGKLRLALLKFGTANWEADVIKHHQLDRKHGFNLDVVPLASKQASVVALQAGAADMILGDWLWVSRQRNAGQALSFFPYSRCVGGLLVAADSPIRNLADLRGKKLGIAGGPIDRSWLLLQVLAKQQYEIDLDRTVQKVFGAPPLLYKKMLDGELDGVINYWHYLAKLEAQGLRQLISMEDVIQQLGFDADTPMLGYVFRESWSGANPMLVAAMMAASTEAKQILKHNEQEWRRLRPLLKTTNEAEFRALQRGFRAGIPATSWIDDTRSPAAIVTILSQTLNTGKQNHPLLGQTPVLAAGTFYRPPVDLTSRR